jgi:hypothetical protein
MWVVALHSLFLYSDPPPPGHPPCDWGRRFSSETLSVIDTPTFSTPVIPHRGSLPGAVLKTVILFVAEYGSTP